MNLSMQIQHWKTGRPLNRKLLTNTAKLSIFLKTGGRNNKLMRISHTLRLSVKNSEAIVPSGPVNTSHRTQLLMGTPRTRLTVVVVICKMSTLMLL